MSEYLLIEEILARSSAKEWELAKIEWELAEIYFAEEMETCLCGHHPIRECCVLHNKQNDKLAVVGNCCVNKFLGLESKKIFDALRRIGEDSSRSLNIEALRFVGRKGWLTSWELKFYRDVMRKRKLSVKQEQIKVGINTKVLDRLRRARRP